MLQINDLIGVPFIDRGRDPRVGLDCWGLVLEVYRRAGIELADYQICCEDASRIGVEIDTQRSAWSRIEAPLPVPALVVMRLGSPYCNHTGIHIGGGRFIHTRSGVGVNIDRIDSVNWRHRIEGFYTPRE